MFKKFLCLLLLVILTSTVTLSALAAGCDNPNYRHGTSYGECYSTVKSDVPVYKNTTYHQYTVTNYYICTMCRDVYGYNAFWTTTELRPESHTFRNGDDVDGGHIAGTHTHKRNKYCKTCNTHFSTTYQCPGPPCSVYLSEAMLETE